MVKGRTLAVDGTLVAADTSRTSRIPRGQLQELLVLPKTAKKRDLSELERENPVSHAELVSATDPDAVLAIKGGAAAMAYYNNYLIDTASRVILEVEATPALFHQEAVAARGMVERVQKLGVRAESLGADKAYGSGEFLAWLLEREVQPHIPVIASPASDRGPFHARPLSLCSERGCLVLSPRQGFALSRSATCVSGVLVGISERFSEAAVLPSIKHRAALLKGKASGATSGTEMGIAHAACLPAL